MRFVLNLLYIVVVLPGLTLSLRPHLAGVDDVRVIRPLGYPIVLILVERWRPIFRWPNRFLAGARRRWVVRIVDRQQAEQIGWIKVKGGEAMKQGRVPARLKS